MPFDWLTDTCPIGLNFEKQIPFPVVVATP
jgi:hypothetical protein